MDAGAAKQAPAGGMFSMVGMMVLIFGAMYFMVIRPQKKEEKRKKEMLGSLQKGDTVVTTSGILGTVATIKDDTVIVKVGDGVRMEFLRSAIGSVRNRQTESGAGNAENNGAASQNTKKSKSAKKS